MIGGGRGPGKKQKQSSEQLKEDARSRYAIHKDEINDRRREKRNRQKTTDAEVLLSLYQSNFQFNLTRFEEIDTVKEETKKSCEDRCDVVINAAFALDDTGDLIGAVETLRQALVICPSYHYVRRALGDMLFRLGVDEEQRHRAAGHDDDDDDDDEMQERFLVTMAKALHHLRKAVKLDPTNPLNRRSFTLAYFSPSGAVTQHRKTIKLDPSRESTEYSADVILRLQRSYGEYSISESEDENLSDEESVSADEEAIISESIDCEDE